MKKLTSILLALLMALTLLPTAVFAETTAGTWPTTAPTNGVYTLSSDVQLTEPVVFDSNTVVDLNGHSITPASTFAGGKALFVVKRGVTLTVKDSGNTGKIDTGNNDEIYAAIRVVNSGESERGATAKLVIDGGTISGYYYAIVTNGTQHDTEIIVNGGVLKGLDQTDSMAIYHPQCGNVTINGGILEGCTTLAMKSGKLTITGGTFIATGQKASFLHHSSGFNVTGDALVVEACDYPGGLPVVVDISGGTFTSAHGDAVAYYQQSAKYKLANEHFITGGTFSTDPTAYVAENYTATKGTDNKYTVGKMLADYTAVDTAIKNADNYKEADYTADSYQELTDAIKAVDRTKTYDQQNDVNAMATAINDAIAGLKERVATSIDATKNETSSTVNESTMTTTTTGSGENVTHTIDATSGNSGTTTAIVNVPASVVDTMAGSATDTNNVTVVIKTDVGTIMLDKAALKAITDNLTRVTGTVTELRMTVKDTTDDNNANHTKRYEVTIEAVATDGITSVYSSSNGGGSATVTVEYTRQNANKSVYVYYVVNGVDKERMNASYADGKLTWTTTHFSTFEVREVNARHFVNHVGAASSTTTDKSASPTTADAGIAIYGVMAISSVLGMGYMGKKKFF